MLDRQAILRLPRLDDATRSEMPPPQANTSNTLKPARNTREIIFDAGTQSTKVEIDDCYGLAQFIEHGLVTSGHKQKQMSIGWGDHLSAAVDANNESRRLANRHTSKGQISDDSDLFFDRYRVSS